ncbi:GAF and ANTAR domain-containing protein [Actinospica sp. MGRD01-02]|uniref:GAF and ANTAR domain-containing protein n=1 Tax=Actinospica acidithermotolerans TaxID=2828514 RepID=A0A941IKU0_9ACTN|nr:GAF and ANTAR domain-containing protein [Actinospica acidithermotolerans]MBR7829287.1 GAF and ANTAR domain-containing protein [Actinospica acidithermotolerans]
MGRDRQLSAAFVGLADTLGEDFDVVDLLERLAARCVAFSSAGAVGIVLSDGRGPLRNIAASQERAAFMELLQLQTGDGPCVECFRTGSMVRVPRVAAEIERWPQLVPALIEAGFPAVVALPLRLRESVIGAVNLFYPQEDPDVADDLPVAQAFSDVAALAMLNSPSRRTGPEDILARLQVTITNKVAVEQAKGFLAESGGISVEAAGTTLRDYAHAHGVRATDLARAVIRREIEASEVLGVPEAAAERARPA